MDVEEAVPVGMATLRVPDVHPVALYILPLLEIVFIRHAAPAAPIIYHQAQLMGRPFVEDAFQAAFRHRILALVP
jgi:hypothetical protein